MAEAAAPPPTPGMRLDQAIASLDNLSSTQLYVLDCGRDDRHCADRAAAAQR